MRSSPVSTDRDTFDHLRMLAETHARELEQQGEAPAASPPAPRPPDLEPPPSS